MRKGMVPAFIKAGVKGIALLATNAEKLAVTERAIKAANPTIETLACPLDNTKAESVEKTFSAIKAKFGHADFLINAAGAASGDGPKLHETEPEAWWYNFVSFHHVRPCHMLSEEIDTSQEVNGKGTYLLIHAFLRQLPSPDAPAAIVNVSSWQPFFVVPQMSGYFMSKFIVDHLSTYVAAEYPNVAAVSLYPGLVPTDMLREPFRTLFDHTSAELVGGTAVWLCHKKADFLSGRWIAVNWDVEDLVARREEIVREDLLKLSLRGGFGAGVADKS